jgi:hypothetical protein
MLAQAIYCITNGNKKRKLAVIIIMTALFIPLIILIILQAPKYEFAAVLGLLSATPFVDLFPIAGWTAAGCTAFLTGNISAGLCFFGLLLLAGAGLALFISLSKIDFYEDALCTGEAAFEKRGAALKGVNKTGLRGAGSAAFFYRHLLEASRRSVVPLLNNVSFCYAGGAALYALFIRNTLSGNAGVITVLTALLFTQILCVIFGEGIKELATPYIYLVPEHALSKIVWSNMATLLRTLLEGALIFAIAGAILRADLLTLCCAVFAYSFFSFKIIALNYAARRWTSVGVGYNGAFIAVYMIVAVLTSLPGVIIGIVAGSICGAGRYFIGLLLFCAWELITGIAGFALATGILDNADIAATQSTKR